MIHDNEQLLLICQFPNQILFLANRVKAMTEMLLGGDPFPERSLIFGNADKGNLQLHMIQGHLSLISKRYKTLFIFI